jgi:trans-aconitate 2-methyltransferase
LSCETTDRVVTGVIAMVREWDARAYDALPLPHPRWAERTLRLLDFAGNETVLEAGCGTGRDTVALLDLLPRGRVITVDGSARMLERLRSRLDRLSDEAGPGRSWLEGDRAARTRLAGGNTVEAIRADLTEPLPIAGLCDAAFSVATFHWIHDHDALFGNIARVLRPGARFAADSGGRGNVARVRAAVAEVLGEDPDHWNFAGPDDTRERLERAGFTDITVELLPDPARFEPGEQFHAFLATVVLGAHLDRLPPEDHDDFVRAVAARLREPVVDYVRLVFSARRAG